MTETRTTMNRKPVFEVPAKSIINFESGFGHKLLCDDLTFSTGSSCAYSCQFCYVPAIMAKSPHMVTARQAGYNHLEDVVIRRTGAVEALRRQLLAAKHGHGKKAALFEPREKPLVIYSSPLVDVAANMELVSETVAACLAILELTPWDIRLLSKSNLLPKVAWALQNAFETGQIDSDPKKRVIYGVSTGTLDNRLAAAFEQGTPLVSKRIESIHALQDGGYRTFGMVCPSLPQRDYEEFASSMAQRLRVWQMEAYWSEVINVRGESMKRTVNALLAAEYKWEAAALASVSLDKEQWEQYSRQTFLAQASCIPPEKLRFLQYVNAGNREWWQDHEQLGAVLLGKQLTPHTDTSHVRQ